MLNFQGEEQVSAEFLAGKVPEIVYKKAIQSIPGTVVTNVIGQLAMLHVVARPVPLSIFFKANVLEF